MGECLLRVGITSSFVFDCEGSPGFAGLFVLDTGACVGHIVTLGFDFAVLPILLVFVISLSVGVKWPGLERGGDRLVD